MAATFVTAAELKTNLGIGTLYDATDVVETACQSAQDLLNEMLDYKRAGIISACVLNNVATLNLATSGLFAVGETVTITGAGSIYAGAQVITATYPFTTGSSSIGYFTLFPFSNINVPKGTSLISFALTHADDPFHLIRPYGMATGVDTKDIPYASQPKIREAAMMIAIDIWQARNTSNSGGVSPDFTPSPYRMGNTLMARVRGLIGTSVSAGSMVG